MPDIDFQKIKLNLIPKKGDDPVVFYASQYETARPFKAALFWGESEFAPGVDYYAEIDIRKNDDNLVVITDDVAIDNNEVSVILPVQALTCIGKNLGQVKIYEADNQLIAALNFILEVQADPLAGGVTSETAIDNLTQQIEDIAQEVIGDDYYNKTETDALLENKANISDIPDMSNYYTKAQTYSSSQIDTALSYKADRSELTDYALKDWVELNFVDAAYLSTHYYNKNAVDALIDDIFPTFTASGAVASFTTALNKHLVSVSHDAGANTITRCGVNFLPLKFYKGLEYNSAVGNTFDTEEATDGSVSGNTVSFNIGSWGRKCMLSTKLPSGIEYRLTMTVTSSASNLNYTEFYLDKDLKVTRKYNIQNSGTSRSVSAGFTLNDNECYIAIELGCSSSTTIVFDSPMLNVGSTALPYTPYNGQTVPVADATTLITLSGVNNVFADSGDVTVQYKYMSM